MSTPSGKKRKLGEDRTSNSKTPNFKTPNKSNSKTQQEKPLTRSECEERDTKKLRSGRKISVHGGINVGIRNVCFNNNQYSNNGNDGRVSDSPFEDDDLDCPSEDDDSDSSFDIDDVDGRRRQKEKESQEKEAQKQLKQFEKQQEKQRKAKEKQRKAKEKKRELEEQQRQKVEEKQRKLEEEQRKVEEEKRKAEERKQKLNYLELGLYSRRHLQKIGFFSSGSESSEKFLEGAKTVLKKIGEVCYSDGNDKQKEKFKNLVSELTCNGTGNALLTEVLEVYAKLMYSGSDKSREQRELLMGIISNAYTLEQTNKAFKEAGHRYSAKSEWYDKCKKSNKNFKEEGLLVNYRRKMPNLKKKATTERNQ